MHIQQARIFRLIGVVAGYVKTQLPLCGFEKNIIYQLEVNCGDDIGLYYWLPVLMRLCDCVSIDRAVHNFFYGLLAVGTVVGIIGFYMLARVKKYFFMGAFYVLIAAATACRVGDIYSFYFLCSIFILPILWFEQNKRENLFLAYSFLVGVVAGFAHTIRSYSSLGLLVFIVIIALSVDFLDKKKKCLLLGLLVMGYMVCPIFVKHALNYRNQQLEQQGFVIKKDIGRHVLWHNMLAGFGFITNDKGLFYSDAVGGYICKKYQVVYPSPEYEYRVKQEVKKLIIHAPHYCLMALFSKFGVLLYFVLLFGNFGLLVAYFYRKPWYIEAAFFGALCANAIPGFIAVPVTMHMVGVISVAALYGGYSLICACERGLYYDMRTKFLKILR